MGMKKYILQSKVRLIHYISFYPALVLFEQDRKLAFLPVSKARTNKLYIVRQ
jgi:hypothetical protein